MKTTKTYKIETRHGVSASMVQAYTCQVTPSGCLILINTNDRVTHGFRDGEWLRFWMVPEE